MDKSIGSPHHCGWSDWLHDRPLNPHLIEDGDKYTDLTVEQLREYVTGWNEAKAFYDKPLNRR